MSTRKKSMGLWYVFILPVFILLGIAAAVLLAIAAVTLLPTLVFSFCMTLLEKVAAELPLDD